MLFVFINTLLYLGLLFWYCKKHKSYDSGFLLIATWSVIAVFAAICYASEPARWQLALWPFLYLFVAFLIYSSMFVFRKQTTMPVDRIAHLPNKKLDILCYIFIGCSFLYLMKIGFSPSSFNLSAVQESAVDLYAEAHEVKDGPVYSNQLEHFVMLYYGYFRGVAIIGMFCYFCQKRITLAYLLAFCIVYPYLVDAMQRASRGSMIVLVVMLLCGYLVFKEQIPKNVRRSLLRSSIFCVVGLFAVLFVISVARFQDSDQGVNGSFIYYLGNSMLHFNYGICDSLDATYMGMRTFKNTLLKLGMPIPPRIDNDFLLGTHIGTGYTTFVGMLCLDFGFVGTLVLGFFISYFFRKLCFYSNQFTYASLYIYFFYLNRMIMGVFVNASGIDFTYYMHILIYVFLFFLFRDKPSALRKKLIK